MSFTALAETILANAKELDKRGVVDLDSITGFRSLAPEDHNNRAALIQAIQEIERMALGPLEYLYHLDYSSVDLIPLHAIVRYKIPLQVPDGGISIQELAKRIKFDEENLTRVIRHAITMGIFQEPKPGVVSHTILSRSLRDNEDFMDHATYATEQLWPTTIRALDALEQWPGSREPTHTAWNLTNQSTEPLFDYLARHPDKLKPLAGMFRLGRQMLHQGPDGLTQSPLWKDIDKPDVTVVDVGGNRGYVSMQLAEVTQHVRFIVEDRPETVKMGEDYLPSEYRSRISFKVHDFFTEQPVKHADVYFFRKILHDWPDYLCVKILQSITPALKDGAMVVVCDRILPEMALADYRQREARRSDLNMLISLNGKERTKREWEQLFAEADSRFTLEFEPWQHTFHGLIKAIWKP